MLLHPVITEKSAQLASQGKYIFAVTGEDNKIEIARQIEKRYKVTVMAVNIAWTKTKKRRIGRIEGKKPRMKKAIVSLKKGDKIDV